MWLSQNFLDHQRVGVDHAVLDRMQREHTDFVVLPAVACHLASACEEHELGRAVPLLDNIQALIDFPAQRFVVQVASQEDGFDGLAEFGKCLIGGVLQVILGETPQDGFGFSRTKA